MSGGDLRGAAGAADDESSDDDNGIDRDPDDFTVSPAGRTVDERPVDRIPVESGSDASGASPDAAAGDAAAAVHFRRIRSFVTRAGRMSPAQQRARDTLGGRWLLPYRDQPLAFDAEFGRGAPVVVEIGFGMGAATATVAAARPDVDFVGIEVHEPGVGALLKRVGDDGLTNVRIVEHDAVEVLETMIAPASLAGVHVWFPDPWHKARHHKRRLIQQRFVALLAGRLVDGGYLHCATDWEDYAVQMREVLDGEPSLVAGPDHRENPLVARPVTKFETRGTRLGHGVWDLVYRKQSG